MTPERTPAESRRLRTLVAAVLVLATGIGLGVAGAVLIKSPESAALENAPPDLPPATATVEEGVLGESLVVDVEYASTSDQRIPAADIDGIVTANPAVGDELVPGSVALEVSGRPIVVISGGVPAYRDFVGGTRGADVVALQSGLAALGYDVGAIDGHYGKATAAAVEALYLAVGYETSPAEASPAEVAVANADVATASAALRDLQLVGAEQAEISAASAALSLARETLTATRDAALTPFPRDEIVFVAGDSLHVVASNSTLGGPATAGVIVVASATTNVVWATVPRSVAARLPPGTPVEVDSVLGEATSEPVAGVVSWVAASTGIDGVRERFGESFAVPSGQVGVEITLDEPLAREDGARLQATIEIGGDQAATLLVPISAVRTAADGRTTVALLSESSSGDYEFRSVEVTVLQTLSGRASVRSTELSAGDRVAIP